MRFRAHLMLAGLALLLAGAPLTRLHAQQQKTHGKRIIGGEPTDIKQHPWQVALNIKIGKDTYLCSGSFVAPGWVLTAAHCFSKNTVPRDVKLKAGVTDSCPRQLAHG